MVDANRIQCAEERYKQTFWSRSQLIRLINKWLWCLCIVSTTIQNHHHHHSENYENIKNKKYRDRRKSRNMHAYHAITNRWSIKVVCYAYKIDNSKCLPHGNGILCYESNTEQRDWYKKMETTACIKKWLPGVQCASRLYNCAIVGVWDDNTPTQWRTSYRIRDSQKQLAIFWLLRLPVRQSIQRARIPIKFNVVSTWNKWFCAMRIGKIKSFLHSNKEEKKYETTTRIDSLNANDIRHGRIRIALSS